MCVGIFAYLLFYIFIPLQKVYLFCLGEFVGQNITSIVDIKVLKRIGIGLIFTLSSQEGVPVFKRLANLSVLSLYRNEQAKQQLKGSV